MAYHPVYNNVASIPQGLTVSTPDYNEESFSWQLSLISDLAVTNRSQYSQLVRAPFKKLENQFIQQVKRVPNPTAEEADKALVEVNNDAWDCMNKVKINLITKVSKDTVLATKNLGRD